MPACNLHLFNLVDVHRLEELSYEHRKRLFVVEASQKGEKEVVQKYGRITATSGRSESTLEAYNNSADLENDSCFLSACRGSSEEILYTRND
jgi:hypothetical protein